MTLFGGNDKVRKNLSRRRYAPYLMYAPAALLIFAVTIYPLLYSLYMSFHFWELGGEYLGHAFVGLSNYISVLTNPDFYNSIKMTVVYTLGAVTLELLIGIGLFLALRRPIRGIGIYRSIIFIPMIVAPVAAGTIWRILYDPDYGIINQFLSMLGLPTVLWLADPKTALLSVMLVDVWQWTPFIVLFLVAGFQALPKEPFESAQIDGASLWQELRYITLPLLSPVIVAVTILRLIEAFKTMDTIFIMTWGGPGTATEVISVFTYKLGFRYMKTAEAAATSFIVLVAISLLLLIWTKFVRFER